MNRSPHAPARPRLLCAMMMMGRKEQGLLFDEMIRLIRHGEVTNAQLQVLVGW